MSLPRKRTRAHTTTAVLFALGAWIAALLPACSDPQERRPNIVLVSIDTLRADHASCYGYERKTTPNLDALARQGVLYERAVSTTSWTLPSHLSMLSGLPISVHGICDDRLWARKDSRGRRIPPPLRGTLVSETLRDAGYATAGFYTFVFLEDTYGFGAGFDTWQMAGKNFFADDVVGEEFFALRMAGDKEAIAELTREHADLLDARRRTSPDAIAKAASWMEQHMVQKPEQPFFLFVHLFDAHDPYSPPPEHDLFGDPSYTGSVDGHVDHDRDLGGELALRGADLARQIACYDGGIHFVDDQVGKLLARLKRLGLEKDTLVIVTADHGEAFFEHGSQTHRHDLYMESVHVPLVMRWPGTLPAGARVKGTVGLVDIAPTIASAARARLATPVVGIDLLPSARGEMGVGRRTYESLLQIFDDTETGRAHIVERQVALLRGDQHTIVTYCEDLPATAETFDLARDPLELGPPKSTTRSGEPEMDGIERELSALRERSSLLRASFPSRGAGLPVGNKRTRHVLAATGYASSEDVDASIFSGRLCIDGCVFER